MADTAQRDHVTCRLCKASVPTDDAIHKNGQAWHCKQCKCLDTMLRRNQSPWPSPEFMECSPEEQADFFKKNAQVNDCSGRLQWKVVKCSLIEVISKRRREQFSTEIRGRFLPLSVWEKKGYDVDVTQSQAEEELHPVLGRTFRLNLKEVNYKDITEKVTEDVLSRERQVRANAKSKAKGKKKGGQGDGDDLFLVPSESDVEVVRVEKDKAKGKETADAEKTARSVTATASKALPGLLSALHDVDQAAKDAELYAQTSLKGKLGEEFIASLKEASKSLGKKQEEAAEKISRVTRGVDVLPLPWTLAECQADIKAAIAQVTNYKQEVKRLRKLDREKTSSNQPEGEAEPKRRRREPKTAPKPKAKAKS